MEADAAAVCFLLFPAVALVAVPSPCFLLGAMALVVSIGEIAKLWGERNNGKKREEEDDAKGGMHREE